MEPGNSSCRPRLMPRFRGKRVVAALLAALALAPLPAASQQAADAARLRAQVLDPLIVENPADMDFGEIVPRGTAGQVIMTAGPNPTCTATNGILKADTTCRAAHFEGDTNFLFLLRVTRPAGNQITLTGPGGATMLLNNFTFAPGPGILNLGPQGNDQRYLILNLDGSFDVYVGGTLHVGGLQPAGVYNGTFVVTFNYD